MPTILERDTLLVDEYMPRFDVTRIEHLVVEAPSDGAYEAIRGLDLVTVHSPLTDLAMSVRSFPERVNRMLGRHPDAPPALRSMRLGDLFDRPGAAGALPGWVPLAEERGRELVFGAVGRFWQADIEWKAVPPETFACFAEPGWGKIAASISALPYGSERSILTYEARTALHDEDSRRRFLRYWAIVSPFVGVVMRATLRTAGLVV